MIFKEWSYECTACGEKQKHLHWSVDAPPLCACGGRLEPYSVVATRNRGVIDDQIEGGPRFFENFGHEPVWIETKSDRRKAMEKYNVIDVNRHEDSYYRKQRKMHDEQLRDEKRV
jgi:hypothetical protein